MIRWTQHGPQMLDDCLTLYQQFRAERDSRGHYRVYRSDPAAGRPDPYVELFWMHRALERGVRRYKHGNHCRRPSALYPYPVPVSCTHRSPGRSAVVKFQPAPSPMLVASGPRLMMSHCKCAYQLHDAVPALFTEP